MCFPAALCNCCFDVYACVPMYVSFCSPVSNGIAVPNIETLNSGVCGAAVAVSGIVHNINVLTAWNILKPWFEREQPNRLRKAETWHIGKVCLSHMIMTCNGQWMSSCFHTILKSQADWHSKWPCVLWSQEMPACSTESSEKTKVPAVVITLRNLA